jgi:hypothetical protein
MVKCRSCDTENQPEVLYCINCGEELNVKITKAPSPKTLTPSKIFCRVVVLFFLCVIAYVMYSLIFPSVFLPQLPSFSKNELNSSEIKLQNLEYRKSKSYTFSPSEITVLYNRYFIKNNQERNPLFITVDDEKNLCFTILVQFYKSLHILTPITITGSPEFEFINNKRTITTLHIKRVAIGKFPIPNSLYKYIIPYFNGYYNNKASNFTKRIFDIKIEKNKSITFILHSKKQFHYNY